MINGNPKASTREAIVLRDYVSAIEGDCIEIWI